MKIVALEIYKKSKKANKKIIKLKKNLLWNSISILNLKHIMLTSKTHDLTLTDLKNLILCSMHWTTLK